VTNQSNKINRPRRASEVRFSEFCIVVKHCSTVVFVDTMKWVK